MSWPHGQMTRTSWSLRKNSAQYVCLGDPMSVSVRESRGRLLPTSGTNFLIDDEQQAVVGAHAEPIGVRARVISSLWDQCMSNQPQGRTVVSIFRGSEGGVIRGVHTSVDAGSSSQ